MQAAYNRIAPTAGDTGSRETIVCCWATSDIIAPLRISCPAADERKRLITDSPSYPTTKPLILKSSNTMADVRFRPEDLKAYATLAPIGRQLAHAVFARRMIKVGGQNNKPIV